MKVLILSADVGEGHAAAARALKAQLAHDTLETEVTVIDGLAALGRGTRLIVQEGYRAQLRFLPSSYSLIYWLLLRVAPVRGLAAAALKLIGARRLRRVIAGHAPEVVVSTYPAVTVVLSHLRCRGRIDAATVATITDPDGMFFWAQPGIDEHLVMFERSIPEVQRIAPGRGARLVAPLIDDAFLKPRSRADARNALDLPAAGRVVVVSGGGWGVGDVAGAVAALAADPATTVVCLAGRNERLAGAMRERFAGLPGVRVLGFTRDMPDLLAAADVLVHGTGGVTCLEAFARGCPVISYGLPVGHARSNTQALADMGVVEIVHDASDLAARVAAGVPPSRSRLGSARAASLVLAARQRPLPAPARGRLRPAVALASAALLGLGGSALALGTDDMAPLTARIVHARPVRVIPTASPQAALVLRAPSGDVPAVVARLQHDGAHAAIATPGSDRRSELVATSAGNEVVADLGRTGLVRWIPTRKVLDQRVEPDRRARPRYFLASARGPSAGQVLLGATAHFRAVIGDLAASATGRLQRDPRRGDVVVATVDGSSASLRTLDRLVASIRNEGLTPVGLSELAASAQATTAGERDRATAAATSTTTAATSTPPWSGVPASRSPKSTGAQATGTSV